VNAVDHQVNSPTDVASGLPSGKRQHQPLVITKDVDQSSPLLYNALVNNENLPTFQLNFYRASVQGVEQLVYTINLTNARITGIKMEMLNNQLPDTMKLAEREKVAFVYQKIEWVWLQGGITAMDDWQAPVV
jgi:type VI secretion system secreted protein Hcp